MLIAEIHIGLWLLLVVAVTVALVQAAVAISNVVRLRNVRMSWKTGKMKGYPLFSTIFLSVTAVMALMATKEHSMAELVAAFSYLVLGFAWFTVSFLTSKRYITDHGIVKNVNEPSQTIAWHQIRDFVEHEEEQGIKFIFIYTDVAAHMLPSVIQLELVVPYEKIYRFRKLISHKLGRRINCYNAKTVKVEEFE